MKRSMQGTGGEGIRPACWTPPFVQPLMSIDKISGQKAVEVRFSVLELSAWGFNPWRAPRQQVIT